MPKPAFKVTVKVTQSSRGLDELKSKILTDIQRTRLRVGVPEGAVEKDGTLCVLVAAVHEFGSPEKNIPERPFLRAAIRKNTPKYGETLGLVLKKTLAGGSAAETALAVLGEIAVGDVKKEIGSSELAPLSQKTIKRKGSSKPLIDTGSLRQSITFNIMKS